MIILSSILLFICPLLSIPFLINGLIKGNKYRFAYCILITLLLSIIAYNFIPEFREDLYRHQLDTIKYGQLSFTNFIEVLKTDTEQLSLIFKYIIYKMGNVDLLQFIVTFLTYTIIFYILCDASKKYKISNSSFVLITIFTFISINYLGVVSNLFCTLALCLFSLGIYLEYICKKNKFKCFLLYIISIFIHSSTILVVVMITMFKVLKEKFNIKTFLILLISLLMINTIIPFLASSSIPLANEISSFYTSYFIYDENYENLHTINVLILYFSKLIPFILAYFFTKDKDKIDDYIIFIFFMIIILFFQTSFSIRYIPIVQLCGIPLLMKSTKNKNIGFFVSILMFGLIFPQIYYQYLQIRQRSFGDIFDILIQNVFSSFRK